MKRIAKRTVLLAFIFCFLISAQFHRPPDGDCSPPEREGRWTRALEPRLWRFPDDHGSHDGYRTEWWYFTGNLVHEADRRYGYQLTFFRQGVRLHGDDPGNPWSFKDVYLGHFALTDIGSRIFLWDERMSRKGPGLAGAADSGLDVWLLNWTAKTDGAKSS